MRERDKKLLVLVFLSDVVDNKAEFMKILRAKSMTLFSFFSNNEIHHDPIACEVSLLNIKMLV